MLEFNFNKFFNLVFISVAIKHFELAFCTWSEQDNFSYRALFSIAFTEYIFCVQLFYKEFVVWSSEGGLFGYKYRNGTWNNKKV